MKWLVRSLKIVACACFVVFGITVSATDSYGEARESRNGGEGGTNSLCEQLSAALVSKEDANYRQNVLFFGWKLIAGSCDGLLAREIHEPLHELAKAGIVQSFPILGKLNELGIGTKRNVDQARYWFRRFAFRYIRNDVFSGDRQVLEILKRNFPEDKFPIFWAERKRVRDLLGLSVNKQLSIAESLFGGLNGYPRDDVAAEVFLQSAMADGNPKAVMAYVNAILSNRVHRKATPERRRRKAMVFMRSLVEDRYLPALLRYAKLCEQTDNRDSHAVAFGLLKVAQSLGAEGVELALARLQKHWQPDMDAAAQFVAENKFLPICTN